MFSNRPKDPADHAALPRALPETAARSRWRRVRLLIKVVELRLRFVVLMAVTGLVFAYWDELWNRYEKWMRPAGQRHAAAAGLEYYCPMHPLVVQADPGTCPICGMRLAMRRVGEKGSLHPGVTARVELTPARIAQAGIRTFEVAYAPLTQTITAVGNVAFDERKLANIVSKVPGRTRVETLHVNVTGQSVEIGQRLAELYSPELSQAIQELVNVSRAVNRSVEPQTAAARELSKDRQQMLRASSEKLRRWGVTESQIDEILTKGKTDFKFPILSPIRGTVLKKNVVEGQEVPEGYPMFEVVDLSTVWVVARVFERQLGSIRLGQRVEATFEAFPGESFPGKVEFIQTIVDPATRTVEIRFALENHDLRLRPGMFATVTLTTLVAETAAFQARIDPALRPSQKAHLASLSVAEQKICPVTHAKLGSMGAPIPVNVLGRKVWTCCGACPPKLEAQPAKYLVRLEPPPQDEVLSVPESAVIDTGTRTVVYIESEPGVFEGREVVLGPRAGNLYSVLDGLAPGEKVAASGAFLIDAESRINPGASASPIANDPKAERPAGATTHGNHRD
jgi:Cu(I)/Ag(I) efflux system membrane fusion protein